MERAREIDRQIDRWKAREINGWRAREIVQLDRQLDRQIDRYIDIYIYIDRLLYS